MKNDRDKNAKMTEKKTPHSRKRLNISMLKIPAVNEAFVQRLKELSLQQRDDWRSYFFEAAEQTIAKQPYISELPSDSTGSRNYLSKVVTELEGAVTKRDMRTLSATTRMITNDRSDINIAVADKNGKTIKSEAAQLQRWKEHFEELLNHNNQHGNFSYKLYANDNPAKNSSIAIGAPSMSEVIAAIRTLKSNRFPGTDGLPGDLLSVNARISAKIIHNHIVVAWESEQMDSEWKRALIKCRRKVI